MITVLFLLCFSALSSATSLIWDGRIPFSTPSSALDTSTGPYFSVVKGSTENATHYSKFLGHSALPTALWNKKLLPILPPIIPTEQVISISIDNTSVFIPGSGPPQYGFRRTELLSQLNGSHQAFNALAEVGNSTFHFSIKADLAKPLNYSHEYQIVFIEPNDGSHVFGIQLGSPFTNPTGPLPAKNAHSFKVLDHALNVLYSVPFTPVQWHNFAVRVDWDNRTLQVFYSADGASLKAVTQVVPNLTTAAGTDGQGDFHIGVIKLPLVNPADSAANQGDVVHYGIQEGTTEGLLYSGVFVKRV